MNFSRIALAAVAAFAAYFAIGFLTFALSAMKDEFMKYPAVYRSQEAVKRVMPLGMAAMFVAMVVLAVLFAMVYRGGSGAAEGLRFGALIGLFAVCSFVLHNYVNLNVGWKLTVQQSIVYFLQWTVIGLVIGLVYRPLASR